MHAGTVEGQPSFATEGIIDGPKQSGTGSQNCADQFSQEQTQNVDIPGGMAEEAMESAPMAVAHVAAREDDLGQIAVSMRKNPTSGDL